MITVLIGHRGVGKTTFLSRIKKYYDSVYLSCDVVDLDKAIEEAEGRSISDLFQLVGESVFREIEINTFYRVLKNANAKGVTTYVALGAGFLGEIPRGVNIWWVRRPTDPLGRVFMDRPRLNQDLSPMDEYMERYFERELRFRELYHREITISEGWNQFNPYESYLLGFRPADLNADLTVLPEHFKSPKRLQCLIEDFLCLGIRYFELRDDLLTLSQIQEFIQLVPAEKILISFRLPTSSKELVGLSGTYATDWACELGPSPFEHNTIVSLHVRNENETIEEAGERLLSFKADHYKLCPEVKDFIELWGGHRFFLTDSAKRSFLPRSKNGRWAWYRLLNKNKMKINFVRTGIGSSQDQPTIFDYLAQPKQSDSFAAVLGDPIAHSHTPAEHNEYFSSKNMNILAIQVGESEFNSLNLGVLERLGMKAAAITSPLKNKIRELCTSLEPIAQSLHSVNTIILRSKGWHGTNTDELGLKTLLKAVSLPSSTVVWGGGGTRAALKSILTGARFFSARKGEQIWVEDEGNENLETKRSDENPEVVVWALGRSRWANTKRPPGHWRPQYIIDLNYTENSPGLEMAQMTGAKYISGKPMFKAQAAAQREFWSTHL